MNRRDFLATSAPIVAVAALAVPALAVRAEVNPDAAILTAFDDYVAAYRRIDTIADDGNPEQEAAYAAMYAAEDAIADATPQTAAGVAAFLKLAFRNIAQSLDADNAVIYGSPLDESELGCVGEKMLWRLIQRLEAGSSAV